MRNHPKFSIIIPVYKVKKEYLEKCIKSVISQTLTDIEIIIVEDGCSSELDKLCIKYACNDERIDIIRQNNLGVSHARNQGIHKSNAEWVLFLDADDWLEESACFEILNVLKENRNEAIDIIQFASSRSFKNRDIPFIYGFESGKSFSGKENADKLYLMRRIIQPTHFFKKNNSKGTIYHIWDKAFRKSFLLEKHILFPEGLPLSEDKVFIFDCINCFNSLYVINKILHHYRESQSSVKHAFSETLDVDRLKIFELLQKRINNIKDTSIKTQLQNDMNGFIVAGACEVVVRKFYHRKYYKGRKIRKIEANEFINIPIVSSALKSVSIKDLYLKNSITVLLLRQRLYLLLYIIFKIADDIKGRQC